MNCESNSAFNYSKIETTYFVSISTQNTSKYFECCWLMVDPKKSIEAIESKDPSFVYSMAESTVSGLLAMLLSIVGAILNFLVICAIRRSRALRKEYLTPSILCLSIIDFVFSVYILSVRSLLGFTRDMPLFTGSCDIFAFVAFSLFQGSVLNLLGISTLRCIAVCFPNTFRSNKFQLASKLVPPTIVLLGLLNLLPILLHKNGRFGFECKTFTCRVINVDKNGDPISTDPFAVFSGMIMIFGILLMIMNIGTFLRVRHETNRIVSKVKETNMDAGLRLLQKERKLGKMIAILTTSFFAVYTPHIILHKIHPSAEVTHTTATIFTTFITCSLVIIDPAIYIIAHNKYQLEIRRFLRPVLGRHIKHFDVSESRGSINSRTSKATGMRKQRISVVSKTFQDSPKSMRSNTFN